MTSLINLRYSLFMRWLRVKRHAPRTGGIFEEGDLSGFALIRPATSPYTAINLSETASLAA